MKIKSYNILFRLFSFLADKTNGVPLFVKYKLLLGTLIISAASSSANTLSKVKPGNDSIPTIPQLTNNISCYIGTITSSHKTTLRGRVQDESGELVLGASVTIKGKQNLGTATDENGYFSLEAEMTDVIIFSFLGFDSLEVPASDLINSNKPIVMQESNTILCYDPIVIRHYRDDIYAHRSKKKTKMPYDKIPVQPVSPVGDLHHFQEWMDKNIKYSETMLKKKVQGDVILSFIVDKEGKITNKKVISKLSPDADAEALRILSSSEKWIPGRYNNKEIKTTITIKVNFKMPD